MKKWLSNVILKKYSKDLIYEEYIVNNMSYREMNKKYWINSRTMTKLLNYYWIPIRYWTEAMKAQRIGEKWEKRREREKWKRKYRIKTSDWYYAILYDWEHKSKDRGRVKEHILIMEDLIGRRLEDGEVVHHIDWNKLNNLPSNLRLMTKEEHHKLHYQERTIDKKTWRFIS